MEAEVLKSVGSYGIFAMLFTYLLFYVLKENSKREAKYQDIINNLTEKFDIVDDIKKDVVEIKNSIRG